MKMQAMRIALEELHDIGKCQKVLAEPKDDDVTWFRHCSPVWLPELTPLTYKELQKVRPDYNIDWRFKTEQQYHHMSTGVAHSPESSFLYATIVGYHDMGPPDDYPGFTYYFSLTREQINQTLFEIVDANYRRKVSKGVNAMLSCMLEWGRNKHLYKSYEEPDLGTVSPRIEVIIPFKVTPELYYPQEEDR